MSDEVLTLKTLATIPNLLPQDFVTLTKPIAVKICATLGVPVLLPQAQSAIESRYGNSRLAREGGNLFSVTATPSWLEKKGAQIMMPTWEVIRGRRVEMQRGFRAYPSWLESFEDWAKIMQLPIYRNALILLRDPNEDKMFEGIRQMGRIYATDPQYAEKIILNYKGFKKYV